MITKSIGKAKINKKTWINTSKLMKMEMKKSRDENEMLVRTGSIVSSNTAK